MQNPFKRRGSYSDDFQPDATLLSEPAETDFDQTSGNVQGTPPDTEPDMPTDEECLQMLEAILGLAMQQQPMAVAVIDFVTATQVAFPHPDDERARGLIDFHTTRATDRIKAVIEREMRGIEARAMADYNDGGQVVTSSTIEYPDH